MPTTSEKRAAFKRLHEKGCFVIPNPWDVGSALYLQSLGFQALASTSAGFAWSRGARDGRVTREEVLAHLADSNHALAVVIANAPDAIRGYEDIKLRRLAETQELVAQHLAHFSTSTQRGELATPR